MEQERKRLKATVLRTEKWPISKDILVNKYRKFSICVRARVLIYIFKNQHFALKYTLKHSLIKNKLISTPTCFVPIRPSSVSCHA